MIKIKLKIAVNIFFVSLLTAVFGIGCTTYQEAYKVTPSGVVEEKEIPESRLIQTEYAQDYFICSKILSSRLYEYVNKRKIPASLPIEADFRTSKAKMRFYLCGVDKDRVLKDTSLVKVINSEKKTVVSAGGSGSYTYKNINNTRNQLLAWLRDNKGYARKGETYAVFWDSPYTLLWFLKRYEVQIVVDKVMPQDEKK